MGKELEGLTVAAVKGESDKAAKPADVAGAAEPVMPEAGAGQGQAPAREQVGLAPTGEAETASPEAKPAGAEGGTGEAGKLAPELQGVVEAQVEAAIARVRSEYEDKDGHLSKLRSKKDKEIAALKRALEAREQADYQAAMELARRDPDKAVEKLAGMVEGERARRLQEQQEGALRDWASGVLEELGLDPEDEAVAEVEKRVGPLTVDGASYAYLGEMGKLAREKEAQRAQRLEKELASTLEGLPALVTAAVAKQMAASGLGAVDGSEQRAPAGANEIKDITSPSKLLAMGWKQVGKKKK